MRARPPATARPRGGPTIRVAVSLSSGSSAGVSGSMPNASSTSADRRERRRAASQQAVRARGQRRRDLARHGEDLAALLEREVGSDQRAASLARLDDDRRLGEAGDDAVAGREAPRRRLDAGRVLGHDQTTLGDARRELGMGGGVVAVDAAAEDGDRQTAGVERAAVGIAVDASREAADRRRARPRRARGRAFARPRRRTTSRSGRRRSRPRDGRAAPGRRVRARTGPPARRRSRREPAGSAATSAAASAGRVPRVRAR